MVKAGFCDNFSGISPTEYDILFRINHPNISSATELITKEQINPCFPFNNYDTGIVMPLADSDASKRMIDPLYACWQAASGLEALHASGYYHLDIKPINCLLYGNVLKLADFGLAIDRSTKYGTRLVATVTHRPPEIIDGRNYLLTEYIDVFSLGVLFNNFTIKGGKQGGYKDPDYITQNVNSIHQKCLTIKEQASKQETFDLTGDGYFINSSIVISLCDMILKMTSFDPNIRGTAKEARQGIENLMFVKPTYHEPQMKIFQMKKINYMNINVNLIVLIKTYIIEHLNIQDIYPARIFFAFFDLYAKINNNSLIYAVCCLALAADIHMAYYPERHVLEYIRSRNMITSTQLDDLIDDICYVRNEIERSSTIHSFFNTPNLYDSCNNLKEIKYYFDNIPAMVQKYQTTSGLFTRMHNHTFVLKDII